MGAELSSRVFGFEKTLGLTSFLERVQIFLVGDGRGFAKGRVQKNKKNGKFMQKIQYSLAMLYGVVRPRRVLWMVTTCLPSPCGGL